MSEVDQWRADCAPDALAIVDALRALIRDGGPGLVETIKWNAPNFAQGGQDRITLGLERDGSVRAVLHRGAAKQDGGFVFEDCAGLAKWPSPDRGVMKFKSVEAVNGIRAELVDLFSRWLEATK